MAAVCGVQAPLGSSKRRGQMATPGERAKADENPENAVCQLGLSNYENGTWGGRSILHKQFSLSEKDAALELKP